MSLQKYVRQVRPRNESYTSPVVKVQNFLSEAYNIPLSSEKDVDAFEFVGDKADLKKLFKYVKPISKPKSSADVPLVGGIGNDGGKIKIRGIKGTDDEQTVRDWIKENLPDIEGISYGNGKFGEGGKKIHENTQEIMVATLCLMNKTFTSPMNASDAKQLIEDAKKLYNSVAGAELRPELLEQFNGNYKDLGTAISSANAIREIVGTTSKAYWTGKGWHEDITHLNPDVPGIKDYNSSDIVVKGGKVFYGFSLKKKARSKDVDPTLINKPITGDKSFLSNILGDAEMSVIESAKNALFKFIIKKYHKLSTAEVLKLPWSTRKRNAKSVTRYLKDIPKKTMDGYVKSGKNVFFKKVDTILMGGDYANKFMVDFLKFVLKFDMPEKITQTGTEFEFYLLTGIGTLKGEEVIAENADVKNLPQTIEVLSDVFKRDQLKLIRSKGRKGEPKLNAYQEGATAAKNFYTITDAGKDILDLEIRYKGEYSANPQFQCIVTPNFKNLFKSKK